MFGDETMGGGAEESWYLYGGVAQALLNLGQVGAFLVWVAPSLPTAQSALYLARLLS